MNIYLIKKMINEALEEDLGLNGDISSEYIFDDSDISEGFFKAKSDGIICGISVLELLYEIAHPGIEFKPIRKDGDSFINGDIIAEVKGRTKILLRCERLALNLLQHMSGIATKTNTIVKKLPSGVKIADTRKTLPNLRILQKYAVKVGGGSNHRMGLFDMVMLKENHIKAAGGIIPAVNKVRKNIGHTVKIEVETENIEEVRQAVSAGADIIMLDNMEYNTMKECCDIISDSAIIEVSGNITEETVNERIGDLPVHIVSCGELTHSVKASDITFLIR